MIRKHVFNKEYIIFIIIKYPPNAITVSILTSLLYLSTIVITVAVGATFFYQYYLLKLASSNKYPPKPPLTSSTRSLNLTNHLSQKKITFSKFHNPRSHKLSAIKPRHPSDNDCTYAIKLRAHAKSTMILASKLSRRRVSHRLVAACYTVNPRSLGIAEDVSSCAGVCIALEKGNRFARPLYFSKREVFEIDEREILATQSCTKEHFERYTKMALAARKRIF